MTKPAIRKCRRKISSTFIEENPSEVLESVAAALNLGERADPRLDAPAHASLLRTVRAWKAAEDLFSMKLSRNRAATSRQFRHYWETMKPLYVPIGRRLRFSLVPAGGKSRDIVAEYFTRLILCSQCEKLGGPCRNCGEWFVKKTMRENRMFCSQKCAGTATKAAERERKRNKKLERARQAIKDYPTRAACWRDLDWKQYAVQAKYGVSMKFLTVAVNQGELKPPKAKATTRSQRRRLERHNQQPIRRKQ